MKRRGQWGEGLPASFKILFFSSYYWAASKLVIVLFMSVFMLVFCLLCCTGSDALCQIMLQA